MKQMIEIIIIVHRAWREANVLRPYTNSDVSEWPNLWKKNSKKHEPPTNVKDMNFIGHVPNVQ